MSQLPGGTVTFVFTDIEGSTRLLQELGDEAYGRVSGEHRRLVRETFAARGGTEIDTQGDAFFFSFPRARDAVAAAVDAQRALPGKPLNTQKSDSAQEDMGARMEQRINAYVEGQIESAMEKFLKKSQRE